MPHPSFVHVYSKKLSFTWHFCPHKILHPKKRKFKKKKKSSQRKSKTENQKLQKPKTDLKMLFLNQKAMGQKDANSLGFSTAFRILTIFSFYQNRGFFGYLVFLTAQTPTPGAESPLRRAQETPEDQEDPPEDPGRSQQPSLVRGKKTEA